MTNLKPLTPQQVLQSMDAKWKYIAKDKNGKTFVYDKKPTPWGGYWDSSIDDNVMLITDNIDVEWQSDDWTQCCVEREEVAEPDNDGWIEWNGKTPRPDGVDGKMIFITDNDGRVHCGEGLGYNWFYIKAYKIIKTPEPYQPPKPDYGKWVGATCWFWDDDEKFKRVGFLADFSRDEFKFHMENDCSWKHCRPARPDEIKFVKD